MADSCLVRAQRESMNATIEGGPVDYRMTTTCLTLPGHRVVHNLGVVRGVTVRSRWIGSQITASLRTLGGGRITEYVELCEQTRAEAFDFMAQHADQMGANAILGVKYDATDLGNNMTEVLAYGTAVVVQAE
jgi:uncharacterized protein YbjQ (UPF0145 family)